MAAVIAPVSALVLPFITADLVRRSDGVWRVVEAGDGQVGDRRAGLTAGTFTTATITTAA